MGAINYTEFQPVRDFVQDIAKVVGKLQQAYMVKDPNDWQRGLEVTKDGFSTQILDSSFVVSVDLLKGKVSYGREKWDLRELSAQELMDKLQSWASSQGNKNDITQPDYITNSPGFNIEQGLVLRNMLYDANETLMIISGQISSGIRSPVFIYPHHFDVSLSWFIDSKNADKNSHQYTFGFSTGDKNIPEPYYYVISYPDANELASRMHKSPSFWNTNGFNGTILRLKDIKVDKNYSVSVLDFFTDFIN
jgi:hypothetical protein